MQSHHVYLYTHLYSFVLSSIKLTQALVHFNEVNRQLQDKAVLFYCSLYPLYMVDPLRSSSYTENKTSEH